MNFSSQFPSIAVFKSLYIPSLMKNHHHLINNSRSRCDVNLFDVNMLSIFFDFNYHHSAVLLKSVRQDMTRKYPECP